MQYKIENRLKPGIPVTLFGAASVAAFVFLVSEQISAREDTDLQTLSVSAFGAIPDDGRDDLPAVQAALQRASGAGRASILSFPPGRYDFFKETATKVRYPVTAVHLQWDLVTPFHLNGSKQLTIDGAGATFMMHGRMTPFVLKNNLMIMQEHQPLLLDVRGFRKTRLGCNRVELASPPMRFALLSDRETAELLPQKILGVKGEPFAELVRVEHRKTGGWVTE